MTESDYPPGSIGCLCDGSGKLIDGETGDASGWQVDREHRFQAFLNATPEAETRQHMVESDRLYIMPLNYPHHPGLPVWVLAQIAKCLSQGGKVMVLAPDEAALHKLAGLLPRLGEVYLRAAEPAGRA